MLSAPGTLCGTPSTLCSTPSTLKIRWPVNAIPCRCHGPHRVTVCIFSLLPADRYVPVYCSLSASGRTPTLLQRRAGQRRTVPYISQHPININHLPCPSRTKLNTHWSLIRLSGLVGWSTKHVTAPADAHPYTIVLYPHPPIAIQAEAPTLQCGESAGHCLA